MYSGIIIKKEFYSTWSWVPDYMIDIWKRDGEVEVLFKGQNDCEDIFENADKITRVACFGYSPTLEFMNSLPILKEIAIDRRSFLSDEISKEIQRRNISLVQHKSEGFWKESVAECALGLTICGLRRIPQLYNRMLDNDKTIWNYKSESPWNSDPINPAAQARCGQYCDDFNFTGGTIAGKRIRIVGAGNIGSHYAKAVSCLGAEVKIYDPYAPDPSILTTGAKREVFFERLVEDAEIFAPMVPLNDKTRGLVTADLINTLPKGCLVVLITRANICDMKAVRKRVLADEIALVADVMDIEPLPDNDPLYGRDNVIITPHIAGRTYYANMRYAEMLAEQFETYTMIK